MAAPYKLGVFFEDEEKFEHAHVWAREQTTGPDRIVAAPRSGHVALLCRLIEAMPAPFWVLYVLVTPRGGGEAGRYQSASVHSQAEINTFLEEFEQYFECDARHHIWIGSETGPELLIYDNHNVIYCYGPVDDFSAILTEFGLKSEASVRFPFPHTHLYNQEFDEDENRILKYWDWKQFPLQDSDD